MDEKIIELYKFGTFKRQVTKKCTKTKEINMMNHIVHKVVSNKITINNLNLHTLRRNKVDQKVNIRSNHLENSQNNHQSLKTEKCK